MTRSLVCFLAVCTLAGALERPGVEFKVFQFPAGQIPRIDGKTEDWDMVPDSYVIGTDQLSDTVMGKGTNIDRKTIDVRVKVGWVKGMDKLYFLYEASDDYWDFAGPGRHADIFELVVDGDLSGGPFIKGMHPNKKMTEAEAHFQFHGVHAQNYHIFTPAEGKEWTMVWGCQPWIKDLPFANAAYSYQFKPGEPGKLVLEFMVTPWDYAPCEGPERALASKLWENKVIGMSWAVLDYDNPAKDEYTGFYYLSNKTTMYGDASDLVAFRLMPLQGRFHNPIEAHHSFQVVDRTRRRVAFRDESWGDITSWKWDFGDGTTSTERHPTHEYTKPGEFTVVLYIEGPEGTSRHARVRDLVLY